MDTILDKEQFKNKILDAIKHPYIWPEIEKMLSDEKIITQKYIQKDVSEKEYDVKIKKIHSEVPSIIAKSIIELEIVFDLINASQEVKADVLKDMSFKFEMNADKGYQCRFAVWFYETINKHVAMYCATQIYIK